MSAFSTSASKVYEEVDTDAFWKRFVQNETVTQRERERERESGGGGRDEGGGGGNSNSKTLFYKDCS